MADRQYELVYILPPDSTEAQVAEVQTQIDDVVSRLHGQIASTDNWGRKRLAYEIARHKEGFYVLQTINGSGELMKELDRRLKVMDIVIRRGRADNFGWRSWSVARRGSRPSRRALSPADHPLSPARNDAATGGTAPRLP